MARFRVAVDTGGTFSDFVIQDVENGSWSVIKVPSTPDDPSRAIAQGLAELMQSGIAPGDIGFFSHGTTVGTNALLEGKFARTGLLVTKGFTATPHVGHQARGHGEALFDLYFEKPVPIAPLSRTGEIPERVAANGEVIVALDEEGARREIRRVLDSDVEAIAVCLLFSFLHPEHEHRVKELVAQIDPRPYVCCSADVAPLIREYPRMSTTLINACLGPILARYVERLHRRLEELSVRPRQRYVMQSNGGTASFEQVQQEPVTTVLSGPAGGVASSVELGRAAGFRDLITFDMGGTSCDVALIKQLNPGMTTQGMIAGRDVAVPMLDIHTVSAGGGTIARVDAHRVLQVGPDSAGAAPGPVCYARGGEEVTVTDCNLLLGYLSATHRLAGRVKLDSERARDAIESRIATPLGLSLQDAAAGVVRLIEVQMAEAVKAISTRRGFDLRDFTLVAFGGAGPVHAGSIAAELGIPRVLVPPVPGCHSALGLLMTEVRHELVRSRMMPLAALGSEGVPIFDELASRGRRLLHGEGFAEAQIRLDTAVDLRYAGQGYELTVPCPPHPSAQDLAGLRRRFDRDHEAGFGHCAPHAGVEVVSFRLAAVGEVPKVPLREPGAASESAGSAVKSRRPVYFAALRAYADCPIYDRDRLAPGHAIEGPAIVEQLDATTVLAPDQRMSVDRIGNLLIHLGAESAHG